MLQTWSKSSYKCRRYLFSNNATASPAPLVGYRYRDEKWARGQLPPNCLLVPKQIHFTIYFETSFATNVHTGYHKWRYKPKKNLLAPLAALFCKKTFSKWWHRPLLRWLSTLTSNYCSLKNLAASAIGVVRLRAWSYVGDNVSCNTEFVTRPNCLSQENQERSDVMTLKSQLS